VAAACLTCYRVDLETMAPDRREVRSPPSGVATSSQRFIVNQTVKNPSEDMSAAFGTIESPTSSDSEANKACQHRCHSCACTPLQIHDQAYLGAVQ
jgi:hypothetical protein